MRYANIPFSMTRASSWFTACKNILRLESFRARSGVVQNVFRGDSRRLTEQDASPARPDMPGVGCSGSRIFCSPYPRGEPRRPSPSARLASDPMRSTRKFHDDVCNNLFRRNDRADLAMDSGSTVTDALPAPTVQAVQAGEERPRPPETRRHTRPVPARRRTAAAKATGSGEKRSHPAT